jgi:hypothetical protein
MAQPIWITPPGTLGTIAEGIFYQIPLLAYEPEQGATVFYEVIAGALPDGVQCEATGLIAGVPRAIASVQGVPQEVARDVTSKFAVRAYTKKTVNSIQVIDRLADRTFTLTVTGPDAPIFVTPAGTIATYYDGSQVTGLQIEYTDVDPGEITVVKLVAGLLPPGLTLSSSGLLSGFIAPNTEITAPAGFSRDGQGYAQYPFDFSNQSADVTYEFTLEITDGTNSNLRTFNIVVYSRNSMTADNTNLTSDNTFVTADVTPVRTPILLTPQGSIGTVKNDNFFAFQFQGIDLDGDPFRYLLTISSDEVPGLTLDPESGWLYGYIPDLGLTENTYQFQIEVYKLNDPLVISDPYSYSLAVNGDINTEITWLTPSNLGTIVNGATSILYVQAVNRSGLALEYRLLSGSNSSLPQGLALLPSGDIAGRCSFNTFALDGGTTTFDLTQQDNIVNPTTFDLVFNFVVEVYSQNALVSVTRNFSITVIRRYNEPYQNLYVQAMPPEDDRALINSLLQNSDIFSPQYIYRPSDLNFGVSTRVIYQHAFGLTASTLDEYYSSLYENHYWKNLVLGNIEVAQARNSAGQVLYEVVYSRIIDNLVNDQGQSVSKAVELPFPVDINNTEIFTVYPNSLINMRDQVIDTVGQVGSVLPLWMLSKQQNGRILGFTPAWVIAYAKPGRGEQIAYNIRTEFGDRLNLVDFKVDRYELDALLTKNWDPVTDHWVPSPPSYTTFDEVSVVTVFWLNFLSQNIQWLNNVPNVINWVTFEFTTPTTFDHNSLQFIDPVDMYTNTQEYDKYLVFPYRNIINPENFGPPNRVGWTNDFGSLVAWPNDAGDTVSWINDE